MNHRVTEEVLALLVMFRAGLLAYALRGTLGCVVAAIVLVAQAQQLTSWNDGPAKQAIIKFVSDVTAPNASTYVAPGERIAVFDNDGTLWVEQPLYSQLIFLLDRVKVAAARHPEWKTHPAYRAIAADDHKALAALGQKPVLELIAAANAGMTTESYEVEIRTWLEKARHPRFGRPYTELTYQPMLELMAFLRENAFKTFIVSGGGVEFMRPWVERVYGIPPEQVIGSSVEVNYEMRNGKPVLLRLPKLAFVDDGPGKPVGIHRHIGRRPIVAFGNADGDLPMLQWTAAGEGPRLMALIRHTDSEREYAYDRHSPIGKLDKALDEAKARGWIVVDMQRDWKRIFPFELQATNQNPSHRDSPQGGLAK